MSSRILVACEAIVLSGGLLRFERLGRALRALDMQLEFLCLGPAKSEAWTSTLSVSYGMNSAANQDWYAVMVPGAGFSKATIDLMNQLRAPNFGVRIQHILNDQSRRQAFALVNSVFRPHAIVFNNLSWPSGSYEDLHAQEHHILLGAVDVSLFRPRNERSANVTVIGGLAAKNAEPLVDALSLLPNKYILKLFGAISSSLEKQLVERADGRVEWVGTLFDQDLAAFYQSIDIAVHTEQQGGWANFAAEAMASGVPLICTPHGTQAFAKDGETAIVLHDVTPTNIASTVHMLDQSRELQAKLAQTGRRLIERYDWGNYAKQFAELLVAMQGCKS